MRLMPELDSRRMRRRAFENARYGVGPRRFQNGDHKPFTASVISRAIS
jgi:hypothetical protein